MATRRWTLLTPAAKVALWAEREADREDPPMGPLARDVYIEALTATGYAKGLKLGYALDDLAFSSTFGWWLAHLFGWRQSAADYRQRLLEP